jgi:hypothetical protein
MMKKLTTLIALLPGTAMAHGMHAPVEPTLHGFAHILPGALVIGMAAVLGILWRTRR